MPASPSRSLSATEAPKKASKNESRIKIKFPDQWVVEMSLASTETLASLFGELLKILKEAQQDVKLELRDSCSASPSLQCPVQTDSQGSRVRSQWHLLCRIFKHPCS